jgi:predicted ferric reductase
MAKALQIIFIILLGLVLFIPGYVFLSTNLSSINAARSFTEQLYIFFRLFGLYALTFVWIQIVTGPLRPLLQKLYGTKVLKFHMSFGIFVLLTALIHPLFFYLAYYLSTHDIVFTNALQNYLGNQLYWYGFLGPIALTFIIATVTTARFRTTKYFRNNWRQIHFLNYFVFSLGWVHGLFIGSDVSLELLKLLYYFLGITFLFSVAYRVGYIRMWHKYKHHLKKIS